MAKQYRLFITRTDGEWDKIQSQVVAEGKEDLNHFIRHKINKLRKNFEDCESCVTCAEGCKKKKAPSIGESSYKFLEMLAKKMKKPISSVVDELIINPILTQSHL